MFDYEKFKSAAYRYRYETAIETENGRLSYRKLLDMTNAVYNALCVIRPEKGVAALLRAGAESISLYLACNRAGIRCISADSRLSVQNAERLAKEQEFSAVVMPERELSRLGGRFLSAGCTTCVTVGGDSMNRIFPAQFSYEQLLEKNDYPLAQKHGRGAGKHVFFDGDYEPPLPRELDELPPREPVYIDLPVFTRAGAAAYFKMLTEGRRCFVTDAPSRRLFSRKKVKYALCFASSARRLESEGCAALVCNDADAPYLSAGGGVLHPEQGKARLGAICGDKVDFDWDGEKLRIRVLCKSIPEADGALAAALKKECADLLLPLDVPKSFVFKKV